MPNKWTKESIIESIKQFYTTYNRRPVANDFRGNSNYPSCSLVQKTFGSWNKGLEEAGLDLYNSKIWDAESILNCIKLFYDENGRSPKQRDFQKNIKYPNVTTVQNYFGSWNKALIMAGMPLNNNFIWSKETIIKAIQDFYKKHNRIPTARDFVGNIEYPGKTTIATHFITFNKAIEASGFTPNVNSGYGTPTKSKDNNTYLSHLEAYFVDNYLFEKYNYIYEPKYNNGWKYDFYLPELDLYIELTGGLRPERFQEKIEFNKLFNINCVAIKSSDVYKKDFNLERLINEITNN